MRLTASKEPETQAAAAPAPVVFKNSLRVLWRLTILAPRPALYLKQ
jgi:hypothetical protein